MSKSISSLKTAIAILANTPGDLIVIFHLKLVIFHISLGIFHLSERVGWSGVEWGAWVPVEWGSCGVGTSKMHDHEDEIR